MEFIKKFWKEEAGQDLVEYVLLAALVALAAVILFPPVGQTLQSIFSAVNSRLNAPQGL
jgi:Flp pilus assembly pilin Flp